MAAAAFGVSPKSSTEMATAKGILSRIASMRTLLYRWATARPTTSSTPTTRASA